MPNVAAVIVTYGVRYDYVSRVVTQVLKNTNIKKVVVVNNGNKRKVCSSDSRLINVNLTNNTGSAGGFSTGIKTAFTSEIDYVWLLDDDNLPKTGALDKLLLDYENSGFSKRAYSSFRDDRLELLKNESMIYPRNSFFEFKLLDRIFFKKTQVSVEHAEKRFIACDTVPYGGLLISSSAIKKIGLPNRNFYLYNDDNEYTYRLKKNGITILCDTDSRIHDLESSWYRKEKMPMFKTFFETDSVTRGMYTIRNRVYFEMNNIVSNKTIYYFNINMYLIFVFLKYMPKNKRGLKRFSLILKMVRAGINGELGKLK